MENNIFYIILIILITTLIFKKNKEKFTTCESGYFLGENEKCILDKSNFNYNLTNLNKLSENLEKLKFTPTLDVNLKVDKIKNADKIIVKKSGSKIKKLDSNYTHINRLYGGKRNKFRGWRTIDMDNRFFFNNHNKDKVDGSHEHMLGFDEGGIRYSYKPYWSYLFSPVKIHQLKKDNHYTNKLIKNNDVIQMRTKHDKGFHLARRNWSGKPRIWGGGHHFLLIKA